MCTSGAEALVEGNAQVASREKCARASDTHDTRCTYVSVTVNGLSVPDLYLRFDGNTLFVFNPRGSKNIEEVGATQARAQGLIAAHRPICVRPGRALENTPAAKRRETTRDLLSITRYRK